MVLLKYGLKELIQDIQPNLHSNMVLLKSMNESIKRIKIILIYIPIWYYLNIEERITVAEINKFTFQYGTT